MKKILKDGPFNRISRDVITNKELSLKAHGPVLKPSVDYGVVVLGHPAVLAEEPGKAS